MKYTLLLLFLIVSFYCNSQTVVIAKRTKKAIYVSADSRVGLFRTDTAGRTIRDTAIMCKMWTNGKFSFATTGYLIFQNIQEAKNAFNRGKTLPEIVKTFSDSFARVMVNTMEYQRRFDTGLYKSAISGHYPLASTIFFGVNADSLFAVQVIFNLVNKQTEQCILNYRENYSDILYGGQVGEIVAVLNYKGTWENEKEITKRMIDFTNIESKLHPMIVSPPIDILKVTKNKVRWLQRKAICD